LVVLVKNNINKDIDVLKLMPVIASMCLIAKNLGANFFIFSYEIVRVRILYEDIGGSKYYCVY
jgi:hypothetical protein